MNFHKLIPAFLLIGLIWIFFFVLNILTPMMGEDFALLVFPYNHTSLMNYDTISQMANRMKVQAVNWNARVGELLSIAVSNMRPYVFDGLNAIFALIFIYLVYIYSFKSFNFWSRKGILCFAVIFLLTIILIPAFGEIFLWRTGSTNYLWALDILLIYCLPLIFYFELNTDRQSVSILPNKLSIQIVYSLFGILAGMTNENTVVVFIVLYIIIIGKNIICKIKTPFWVFSTFITVLIGSILLLTAPSTRHRIAYYRQALGVQQMTIQDYLFRMIIKLPDKFVMTNLLFIALIVCLFLIYLSNIKKRSGTSRPSSLPLSGASNILTYLLKNDINIMVCIVISFGSIAALGFNVYIEIRSFILTEFFILCGCIYLFRKIVSRALLWRIAMPILFLCGFFMFLDAFFQLSQYKAFFDKRQAELLDARRNSTNFQYYPYPDLGNPKNRIINTREEYLLGGDNLDYLRYYYNKYDILYNNRDAKYIKLNLTNAKSDSISQVFFDIGGGINETDSVKATLNDVLYTKNFANCASFRIDPVNNADPFTISSIVFVNGENEITIPASEITDCFDFGNIADWSVGDSGITFSPVTDDPMLFPKPRTIQVYNDVMER